MGWCPIPTKKCTCKIEHWTVYTLIGELITAILPGLSSIEGTSTDCACKEKADSSMEEKGKAPHWWFPILF